MKTEETNQLESDSDSDTEDLLYTNSRNYKDHCFTKSTHYAKKKTYQPQLHQRPSKDKIPLDSRDNITRCNLCESINHWAPDCSDKTYSSNDTWLSYETIPFQADFDHPSELKDFLSESWNAASLDSGASKTIWSGYRVTLTHYLKVRKQTLCSRPALPSTVLGMGKPLRPQRRPKYLQKLVAIMY